MKIKVIYEVLGQDEEDTRKALEDGDLTWVAEIVGGLRIEEVEEEE